ncbi:MAG: hypothetical protein HQ488_02520 [Parcubacteria group bacterium]|nr:hypothetical protein [Parcubacteria group bacterium]
MIDSEEKTIQQIKERNRRVEADKAWETSRYRVISITLITYTIATAVMWGIEVERPWLGALIPTIGYYLSTQSLPFLKKRWIEKHLSSKKID